MSDRMRPVPFRELLLRGCAELRAKGSLFDIPRDHFWKPAGKARSRIFSSEAANPIGPAAGPHTQLSQNIICAWLTGARYIELKTVQKLDELSIEKPCIDAADEGYNVEWSQELTLDQAYDEYLKAWMLLHVLQTLEDVPPPFLFNMSVGYDLSGIRSERMDQLIRRLMDSSKEPLFQRYREELEELAGRHGLLNGTPWADRASLLRGLADHISPRLSSSVTLSTMHGCPPEEIESICAYMLEEKGLDTLVKLNPTLLGYEEAKEILSRLGFGYVALKPEGFQKDLQYGAAVPMLARLLARGGTTGRHFGAKLSNTLAAANDRRVLPGAEMYMSGRALYPLTVELAARLAADFKGRLPLSFSGGISAWNLGDILDAGVRPVTLATELLKPGGYARLKELAEIAEAHAASWSMTLVSAEALRRAAEAALASPQGRKDFRGAGKVAVAGPLPLVDCFVAPCVEACPIHQDVPEYVHLAGAGRMADAFRAVIRRNPLPFMTGCLCDHQCMDNCTRRDWEGAVHIREVKRIAAEEGCDIFRAEKVSMSRPAAARGVKVAVIGAGPGGLAAASLLSREGFEVHVFEQESEAGGVVRWLLPEFRISAEAIDRDVALLRDLGAALHFASGRQTVDGLRSAGFRYLLVAIGAAKDREAGIPGARGVLSFLRRFRMEPGSLRLGKTVAVIGGGDTAMDAARAAKRCEGVAEVRVVYRRTLREMPASEEEYRSAVDDGVEFCFLRAPETWSGPEGLSCRVMELGAADESGRSRPVATETVEQIPADTVISAVGTEVDSSALGLLGLDAVRAVIDPATLETQVPGVFLIGDAAEGAATIVKAIASARRAADAILAREGGPRWDSPALPAEDVAALRASRDRLLPVSRPGSTDAAVRQTESRRCLGCRALCMKCVEVCPNRANTLIPAGGAFRDAYQIVHIDAYCNECGNCATFCPWDGKPYKDKLTVFATEEDFRTSTNPGFFLSAGKGALRAAGRESPLALVDGIVNGAADPEIARLVQTIVREYQYLAGGTS
jgi:putative selenate reductase